MKSRGSAVEELMELEREAYRRNVARDIQWIKEAHAREALMLAPGSEPKNAHTVFDAVIKMQAEQGEKAKQVSSGGDHFSWEPAFAQVSDTEDIGWVYGSTKISKADGSEVLGKYVSVWIKEDGRWKTAAEIRNDNV